MPIGRRGFLASIVPLLAQGSGGNLKQARTAQPPANGDGQIIAALNALRKTHGVPGLTAGIVRPGSETRVWAVGLRKADSAEAFGSGDLVHLGSCTKAMTSTMIATLVEDGALKWASTLREVFPDVKMHDEYRQVTLTNLLTHRAGLPENADWWKLGARKTPTEQRKVALEAAIDSAPLSNPGTKYRYSNLGYAIAGLMAETVTKRSWEDLMRSRLFTPLEMKTAGFGVPGTKGRIDQPWGHTLESGKSKPIQHDNAPALGPAGTVHCTMEDWGKFLTLHLRGSRGEKTRLLKPESFQKLQRPAPGEDYAMGWIATSRPWAGGPVLTHNGSNTYWYCTAWVAPKKDFALISAANQGGGHGEKVTDQAVAAMIERFLTRATP